MYFIYGEELFLIEKEIKKIIKKNNCENPIYFNDESSIYDVMNEINTFSIFDDKKLIILKNFYLLNKSDPINERQLIKSINNKNNNCILIFTFSENKPKTPNILFKYLLDTAETVVVKKYTHEQLIPIMRQIVESKGGTISNINSILLSTKLPNDLKVVIREIDKLLVEDNEITKEMILTSVPKYNTNNIFGFINALQEKDVSGLFRNYYEKIEGGELITNLISQISNTLILCSTIHSYKTLKIKLDDIAKETGIHAFRIKKSNELLSNFGFERIKKLIQMLSDLDKNIKIGMVNEIIGFEKLLLEIVR